MPPEGSTSILDSIPPQVLEMILQSLSRQQQPQPPADVGLPKSRFMRTVGEFGQFAKLPPGSGYRSADDLYRKALLDSMASPHTTEGSIPTRSAFAEYKPLREPIPQMLRPPVSDDTNLLNFLR